MSTAPDEVLDRPTQASRPELWSGPSFLWSTGAYGEWRLFAGGWRYRCTTWERRFLDAHLAEVEEVRTPWGWESHLLRGPEPMVADTDGPPCDELDVILDSTADNYLAMPGLSDALRSVLGDPAAAELTALPRPGSTSVTRNRPLLPASDTGLRVADIRFSTLPYSHSQRDRPIQFASRWLRLAATGSAVVSLWGPPDGPWQAEHVRWPHHAVPSRRVASLAVAGRPASVTARLMCVLADGLEHERYYLDTWQMELEAWEAQVYASLADGEAVFRGLDLSDPVRARAGGLATFLSRTQFDLRALRRRADVEDLFADEQVRLVLRDGLTAASAAQADNQRLRREAFSLLTAVAAGEQLQASRDQADAAEAQQRATEALQQTITWVTALLLAPTVVIGVFGANVAQFAPGSTATLPQLAGWALLASGISTAVLWWRSPPRRTRWRRWPFPALLLAMLGVGAVLLAVHGRIWALALWSATVAAWLVAAVLARYVRRSGARAPLAQGRPGGG